eukprot:143465_1
MSAPKPRTTRKKRTKNAPQNQQITTSEPSYFDSALDAVSGLSVAQKVGFAVSAIALLSTAAIQLSSSSKKQSKDKKQNGKSFGEDSIKGSKTDKIPTAHVTKAFQACLASKRPQQQLIADQFYAEIKKWSSEQLEVDGQTIVVNFLFWYYRSMNVPETRFHSEQAEHIRYWADYPITSDVKWDYYNIKFDYMYSTALLQKSIPHMKQFYKWIQSETPRPTPDDAKSRKPNYHLTRYQAACILGDWEEGVRTTGQLIKDLSSKATASTATRNDFFMHYTLRALELPASNPNFGLIYKIVDRLLAEFPKTEQPPPVFTNWSILSFKYRNTDYKNNTYLQDQEFVFASDKIKDADGYYTLYPTTSTLNTRLHKKINIWGRVCQMVSPVFGAAGFLPLTGSWSDTKLYMETSWTYRGSGQRLTRKHVIMRVERLPVEQEVESKDFFGKTKSDKGYVWKGHLTVHMKRLKAGMSLRDLYDKEGEDYFSGEKAIKEKEKEIKKEDETQEEVKGNGAVNDTVEQTDEKKEATDADKEEDKVKEDEQDKESENAKKEDETDKEKEVVSKDTEEPQAETETQIYEVELIINKDDGTDKDRELKKRIL